MGKKLNIGIIGAGWIANHHIAGYIKSNKADIVAISDVKEDAVESLKSKYSLNCKYYEDYRDLLKNKDIEAVSICAPNKYHSEMTVAAAEQKKHILCEKPFVSSIKEAVNSLKAIKENDVKCAVGFHRRFNPLYQEMKKMKDAGRLGEIFFCQCDYIHNQMKLPIIKWTLKKEFNPSLFHAGGSHCVDLLRFLTDSEIVECTAFVSNKSCPECETEADTIAIYRFESGALGKVMRIAPTPITSFEFNVELYGTKGTFKNNTLVLDSFPDYWDPANKKKKIIYPEEWIPNNTPGITEPWDVEILQFVDWILSGKEDTQLCQAVDAVKVAEACWAAVISNKERRVVKLPLIEKVI